MEPLVSVIIPVYNVLPYLREALDSVINQTYKNLEILIVDDGSTDGSGEVCDEYLSDPRVIVIHQKNKGLSGARNTGLDRMTGEYVAFLDSDDAFMPEMVENMLDVMIHNEAEIGMCSYSNCLAELNILSPKIDKVRNPINDRELILSSSESLNLFLSDQTRWSVWDKLYKRSIWNLMRFPEGENFEDMRVMCQVLELCNRIVIVPDIFVLHRQRSGSISLTYNEKNLRDFLLAVKTVEHYAIEHSPKYIASENLHSFQEKTARVLSIRYARLLFCPHSHNSLMQIRSDILLYWNQIKGISFQFHSYIVRFLFFYAPVLILPSSACWGFGKRLVRKVIRL